MIPIYKPYLPDNSLKYAHEAINSTWVSSHGKYIKMVEEKLQELLNVKYVLAVNNGTAAGHLVSKTLSKLHNKTEIIVPNNVYIASWNAFIFDHNYRLLSIDSDLNTWNADLSKLDRAITLYPRAAVLIVHNLGNIINVPELQKQYPNTIFVEDNCEGFLGKYDGVYSGTKSFASSVSFYGNKNITSGEGGAFITDDENAYQLAKCIHGQGQSSQKFLHTELGYNYRMTNVQAALLYGQLDILPQITKMKERVFNNYRNVIDNRDDVFIQKTDDKTKNANWMFGIRIPNHTNYQQAEIYFTNHNIEIRPMFYSMTSHDYLLNDTNIYFTDDYIAKQLQKECFILPSYPELTLSEQNHIIKTLNNYIKQGDQ